MSGMTMHPWDDDRSFENLGLGYADPSGLGGMAPNPADFERLGPNGQAAYYQAVQQARMDQDRVIAEEAARREAEEAARLAVEAEEVATRRRHNLLLLLCD